MRSKFVDNFFDRQLIDLICWCNQCDKRTVAAAIDMNDSDLINVYLGIQKLTTDQRKALQELFALTEIHLNKMTDEAQLDSQESDLFSDP